MINIELVVVLVGLGGLVGVLAGLLGIGGGLLIVPALLSILPQFGISVDIAMQMALATSLACIILTSGSSAWNHFRLNNVDMYVVKYLLPGVIVGGFSGSYIADIIPSQYLPKIFGVIVLSLSVQMFVAAKSSKTKRLPGTVQTLGVGGAIGMISSLAGIGGGSLMVPYLSRRGVPIRKAIGSAALCGTLLATSGMIGFIVHGMDSAGLPALSIGYVYLPALLAIASSSVLCTKIGARLATSLPTVILKRCFSVLLLVVAMRMLFF